MVSVPLNKVTTVTGGGMASSFTTKFEEYAISNADGNAAFSGAVWAAQVFKANTGHTLTGLKLALFADGGDPGTITMSIQGISGGDPDGTDLSVTTLPGSKVPTTAGTFTEIAMPPVTLAIGVSFAIVIRVPTGNSLKWENDGSTPSYADGQGERSTDSGAAWTAQATDFIFEDWGFA